MDEVTNVPNNSLDLCVTNTQILETINEARQTTLEA